ncbi:MAG TPA: 30S ribosomal protein S1 [Epsilonproteobacteria bacterium]|nr:30S ribosomal protein S1 [Campylobacterota bacterium]
MKFEDIEIEEVDFGAMLEESFKREDSGSNLVSGKIVQINEADNQAIIDIGRKKEAIMSLDQLRDGEGALLFTEGDDIDVVVTGSRGDRAVVSYEVAKKQIALKEFIESYDETQEYIIDGVVTKKNKGGYIVECDGLEFFMPKTLAYLSQKIDAIGRKIKAIVTKVDKDKNSVIISRKELIERESEKIDEVATAILEKKEPLIGVVKKITNYGLFVDVGGVDGLVHYSQISHKGPVNPSKYFSEGDEVSVIGLDYDKKKRHLSLSIKSTHPDPWKDIEKILSVGDTVSAQVSNIEPYGVFVDLGEDLEAFLHVSEISWDKNVKHPQDYLTIGQEVNVEIIEINKEEKRLRVSLKKLSAKPIDSFVASHKVGDVVRGVVTSITDFGAFVKIGNIEGLLHNQEISWDKTKTAKNSLKSQEEVEVKIIKIDKEAGKISLSKKALEDSPTKQFAATHKVGDIVEGVVKDKKDFGVFISINGNIDALIRTEDLAPLKIEEIEKGKEIKAVIVFMDIPNDRIRASVKRLERQQERDAISRINTAQDDSMTLGDILKDQLKK